MSNHPLRLPTGWRRDASAAAATAHVVVAARGPTGADGVRPGLVLRREPVGAGEDVVTWQRRALAEVASSVVAFDLEDEDEFDLLGHEVAYRRYAHLRGGVDVLCDQWAWLVPGDARGLGVTLTCSVARTDYWDHCDVFEAVAESVDPTA